jgi:oxygen-independent coproporphyrinogen-3 oxidase
MLRAVDREGHEFTRAAKTQAVEPGFSPCGVEGVRFAAAESLEQYVSGAGLTRTIVSRREALEESFFLGLRLTRGVNLRELSAQFGEEAVENSAIAELVDDGLIERRGDFVCLTSRGRLLSNEVFQRFILTDGIVR